MKLFGGSLETLEHALDVRGSRHTILASDLANADTPGFMPVDINFDQALQEASTAAATLAETNPDHLAPDGTPGQPMTTPLPEATDAEALAGPAGIDGNRVDVDRTLAALAENGLQYSAAARAAGKQLAILRYVASDGVG